MDFNDPFTTHTYLTRRLCRVAPEWDRETLLGRRGIFLLSEVTAVLDLSPASFKRDAFDLDGAKGHAWIQFGLALNQGTWYVNMDPFAKHYRDKMQNRICEVRASWDTNQMLAQKGVFYLAHVVEKLPFTLRQIRRQAHGNTNPRAEMGMWKDDRTKTYLVDMEVFAAWITKIWRGSGL